MPVPADCKTIFVRNLPYDLTEDELGDKFKPCGDIRSIRFVYNTSTNNFKGFSYIQFEDNTAVLNALKLNGKPIKGRNMIVDFEETGPKGGYKYRTEKPSKFNKEYNEVIKKSMLKKRKRSDKK